MTLGLNEIENPGAIVISLSWHMRNAVDRVGQTYEVRRFEPGGEQSLLVIKVAVFNMNELNVESLLKNSMILL